MQIKMSAAIIVWRMVLFGVVLLFIGSIINYHLPFGGVKRVEYGFQHASGMISMVYPVSRVKDVQTALDGIEYRLMVEDPLYVDVQSVVPYKTATIQLTFTNTTGTPLKIGIKRSGDAGILLEPFNQTVRSGEWTMGTVSFDLADASYYNNKYTFVFSVPGLVTEKNSKGDIRLAHMTITLKRDPFSFAEIQRGIKKLWSGKLK